MLNQKKNNNNISNKQRDSFEQEIISSLSSSLYVMSSKMTDGYQYNLSQQNGNDIKR